MAEIVLELKAEPYYCEPCSLKQGTLVRELVRMIPRSVVLFDKLVGDEYFRAGPANSDSSLSGFSA